MERIEELLYKASVEGNVTVLTTLLQEDPLILDRVTLINRYGDTPLHVASMLGHVDFAKEILIRKPYLAMETDSNRRLPLHIASAKGHVEVVRALLLAASRSSEEACLARDCEGRNPLELAAIKGRFDVVKEVVQTQPQLAAKSVMVQQQEDTILHLCVVHNQFEILKLLIETFGDDREFVNAKDSYGNNILHLAVVYRQIETINFLLLNTSIEVNASNTNGETPMDILAQGPRDLKYQQILQSLTRVKANMFGQDSQNSEIEINLDSSLNYYNKKHQAATNSPNFNYIKHNKTSSKSSDWLDQKRNSLMVVASLIATMAFQAGISPPGGLWQGDDNTSDPSHVAGYAIMASRAPFLYRAFLICNTVGFVATLSTILLLISGLPFVKRRVFMWILIVVMWIAVTCISLTYLVSILVWIPKLDKNQIINSESQTIAIVAICIVFGWVGLMCLIILAHVVRVIVVIVRHTIRLIAIAMKGIKRLLFHSK